MLSRTLTRAQSEVAGKTLRMIQGEKTEESAVASLMDAASRRETTRVCLTNYTRSRIPFKHVINVTPLRNSLGEPVLYKAESSCIELLAKEDCQPAMLATATGIVNPFPVKIE